MRIDIPKEQANKKLNSPLLTEFEIHAVSYGPSFFPLGFMAHVQGVRAINLSGKYMVL